MSELRRRILLPGEGESIVYPTKGQTITIDLGSGTYSKGSYTFFVASITGSKALLSCKERLRLGVWNSSTVSTYVNSWEDKYLTQYFYPCLSSEAKSALLNYDVQLCTASSSLDYLTTYDTIQRSLFAPGAIDIKNCLGSATTTTMAKFLPSTTLTTLTYLALREKQNDSKIWTFARTATTSKITTAYMDLTTMEHSFCCYIDLSKIPFTIN